jgi:hypothetical protein
MFIVSVISNANVNCMETWKVSILKQATQIVITVIYEVK